MERALTACNEALDWALTQGNRKLFDLATSTSIRINQGVPLPNIEGVDDQFKVVGNAHALPQYDT